MTIVSLSMKFRFQTNLLVLRRESENDPYGQSPVVSFQGIPKLIPTVIPC